MNCLWTTTRMPHDNAWYRGRSWRSHSLADPPSPAQVSCRVGIWTHFTTVVLAINHYTCCISEMPFPFSWLFPAPSMCFQKPISTPRMKSIWKCTDRRVHNIISISLFSDIALEWKTLDLRVRIPGLRHSSLLQLHEDGQHVSCS